MSSETELRRERRPDLLSRELKRDCRVADQDSNPVAIDQRKQLVGDLVNVGDLKLAARGAGAQLIGEPQRARYLDEALEYVFSFPGTWKCTADDIARHYLQHHYDTALADLDAQAEAHR